MLVAIGWGAGVTVGGIQQASRTLLGGTPWNWAEMALYVLLWTAIMPPAWRLIGRTAGRSVVSHGPVVRTRAQLDELIASALRVGALPADANPDFWRPALTDEARRLEVARWASVGAAVVGSGLIGAAALVADDDGWTVGAVAVVVAALGVVAARWFGRELQVARRLLADPAIR